MSTSSTTNAPLQNFPSKAFYQKIEQSKHSETQNPGGNFSPLSPPSSTTDARFDASAPCSPQDYVFTPQSALSMSAQTSDQGFTPTSYSPNKDNEKLRNQDEDAVMQETSEEILPRTSSKHRMSEDDVEELVSHKRRRMDHDRMEIEENPADPILPKSSVSPLYKIDTAVVPLSRPHATSDLFSLYSLSSLASSVARNDPITGAKINTLKKSYKGKLKDLAGKNRANANPGELRGLLDYPDEEWQIQRVMGKELVKRDAQGHIDSTFDPAQTWIDRLNNAVKMQPGELPRAEKERWEDLLGLDEPPVVKAAPPKIVKPGASMGVSTVPLGNNGLNNYVAAVPPRPKRQNTKRNYDDASFEGYRELAEDVPDSDGDDDGRSGKRKRRKSNPPSSAPSPRFSYASAAPAGVSVGSGSVGVR